jgi:hypothetical protein
VFSHEAKAVTATAARNRFLKIFFITWLLFGFYLFKFPMVSQLGIINHTKVIFDNLLLGMYLVKVLYNFEIA